MAHDVTSEWDDIHRKLGNYEELPYVKPEEEYVQENINKLEALGKRDINPDKHSCSSDFDSDDEEFFEEYKRKKLEKMDFGGTNKKKKTSGFGGVKEITSVDYVREVNEAGDNITVLLNFYQDYNIKSIAINDAFDEMAKKHKKIKFLKTIATRCVEKFPDANLPYILYYRNGKLMQSINKDLLFLYPKLSSYALEHLFSELKVEDIKFKKKDKKTLAMKFLEEKLGKKQVDLDIDSDEEEREDKQYLSNKVFIKY